MARIKKEIVYKIWIEVERCEYTYDKDGNMHDNYEDLSAELCDFGPTANFDTKEEAEKFAGILHGIGVHENIMEGQ